MWKQKWMCQLASSLPSGHSKIQPLSLCGSILFSSFYSFAFRQPMRKEHWRILTQEDFYESSHQITFHWLQLSNLAITNCMQQMLGYIEKREIGLMKKYVYVLCDGLNQGIEPPSLASIRLSFENTDSLCSYSEHWSVFSKNLHNSRLKSIPGSKVHACMHAKSFHSCPTHCDPMDCSLPSFSVHGILQARILEWVAMPFSSILRYECCIPQILWCSKTSLSHF